MFVSPIIIHSVSGWQDRVLINQWKDEMISGFRQSAQIIANMNKKVRSKYGADMAAAAAQQRMGGADTIQASQRSLEKCSSEES